MQQRVQILSQTMNCEGMLGAYRIHIFLEPFIYLFFLMNSFFLSHTLRKVCFIIILEESQPIYSSQHYQQVMHCGVALILHQQNYLSSDEIV